MFSGAVSEEKWKGRAELSIKKAQSSLYHLLLFPAETKKAQLTLCLTPLQLKIYSRYY